MILIGIDILDHPEYGSDPLKIFASSCLQIVNQRASLFNDSRQSAWSMFTYRPRPTLFMSPIDTKRPWKILICEKKMKGKKAVHWGERWKRMHYGLFSAIRLMHWGLMYRNHFEEIRKKIIITKQFFTYHWLVYKIKEADLVCHVP